MNQSKQILTALWPVAVVVVLFSVVAVVLWSGADPMTTFMWIMGLVVVAVIGAAVAGVGGRPKCPECRKAINARARKCPYCQSNIN